MKKIALTSLIAMFAFAGAHAANVIDGNPLYMPKAGHFYSTTSLYSHSEGTPYSLGEEFGYGVLDNLAVTVETSATENKAFDEASWNDLSLTATFRALDMGAWKADIYGTVGAGANPSAWPVHGGLYVHDPAGDLDAWFDKEATGYKWTAGVRGGYTTSLFTVAGHVEFGYMNSEMFNWGDAGLHTWALGLDGQYVIDSHFSILAGVEYTGISNDHLAYDDVESPAKAKNEGVWTGEFGINYNIDATKYVGLYVNGALNHHEGHDHDEWGWSDGFGYGVKFGIDF